MKECDRCGDDYESYIVFIRDDFSEIVDCLRPEYENLCEPCRAFLHPRQAWTGAADVEPKEEI